MQTRTDAARGLYGSGREPPESGGTPPGDPGRHQQEQRRGVLRECAAQGPESAQVQGTAVERQVGSDKPWALTGEGAGVLTCHREAWVMRSGCVNLRPHLVGCTLKSSPSKLPRLSCQSHEPASSGLGFVSYLLSRMAVATVGGS